VPIESW